MEILEILDRWIDFLKEILDNDTLTLIFVFSLAVIEPSVREAVAGGFLGYIVGQRTTKPKGG